MGSEDLTPPPPFVEDPADFIEDPQLIHKYPRFEGNFLHRVTVDWEGIPNPDYRDEWKIVKTGRNSKGIEIGMIRKFVNGEPVVRYLPLANILSNQN